MKTRIYTKWSAALALILIMSAGAFSQSPPITTFGTSTYDGTTLSVPVKVSGFTNVGDISMKLNYDNTQLVYAGTVLNSGLIPANAVVLPVSDQTGLFRFSYSSATAIVLAAPTDVLLTINFTFKAGLTWVASPLTWSTAQGDCDMTPPAPGSFTPPISSTNLSTYFVNGGACTTPVPTITGPAGPNMQETVSSGITTGAIYSTEPGMTGYTWAVSPAGAITAGAGTNSVTVTWTNPTGQQWISVNYVTPGGCTAASPMVLLITYYPFAPEIVPTDRKSVV